MSNSQQFLHILVIEDKKGRRVITLEDSTYSIGRDSKNSIVLYDSQVSRYHATLLRVTDYKTNNCLYRVMDGDLQGKRSTNGLMINGRSCLSHELSHGDYIFFGSTKVKATYQIISSNAEIDIIKDSKSPSEVIAKSKSTISEQSKKTIIFNNNNNNNNDTEIEKLNTDELVRLASFPELSPNPIIEINWQGEITYLNPAASLKFKDIQQSKTLHPILADLLNNYQNRQGSLFVREVKIGAEVFEQYVHYLSERKLIRSYIFDFTKRKQIETALREREERYRAVVRQTSEGIFLVDASSKKIIEANNAYTKLLGYTAEEILQLTLLDVVAINGDIVEKDLEKLLAEKVDLVGESLHRKKNGSLINVEVSISLISYGEKNIFCFVVRDISSRKMSDEAFEYQAFHDPLTGLPNRTLFNEHISTALANAKRYNYIMAVFLFDIEQFKNINNNFGHNIGDQVLQRLGQKLRNSLRSGDVVGRWGNDEFVVLLPRITNLKDVGKVAGRLMKILQQPMEIENQSIKFKLNIGICIHPQDGQDSQTLFKYAETALETYKKQGGNNYEFSSSVKNNTQSSAFVVGKNLLQQALEKEELLLYYQPVVNIKTKELSSIEAFLHWQHSPLGLVSPKTFIHLAEERELIISIGEWVLYTACKQNKLWQQEGLPAIPIGVNISKQQFEKANFIQRLTEILEQTGLEPQWLELEITEETIIQNLDYSRKIIQDLFKIGVSICLDNFGTGASSVGYVKQFQFNTLKIADSVVKNLNDDSQQVAIVSALISLGTGFNMRVVAEGVETENQLALLKELQCQEIQGKFFSQPLPAEEIKNFLKGDDFNLLV